MAYVFSYQGVTPLSAAKNVLMKLDKPIIPVATSDYVIADGQPYTYFLVPRDGFYSLSLNVSHSTNQGAENLYNGLTLRMQQNFAGQELKDGTGLVLRSQQAYGVLNAITGIFPLRRSTAVFAVIGRAPTGGQASGLFSCHLISEVDVSDDHERSALQMSS